MKTIAAIVGLAAVLVSTTAEACNIRRITGWYDVFVTRTSEQGSHHTVCQFQIGRISRHQASLNIHCNERWNPRNDKLAAPFVQDGFRGMFPWHQMQTNGNNGLNSMGGETTSRCMWDLVDLNSIEGPYIVSFSWNGQAMSGQGHSSPRPAFLTFHGVKVLR